jgi:hypothetical protein
MMVIYPIPLPGKSIHSALEKQLIQSYLLEKGYQRKDINKMPLHEARELLAAASRFASLKLAEIESRSKFVNKIHFEP